jgi:hypothetical protein
LYEAPLVAPISEGAYRWISRHRPFCLKLTHLFWGKKVEAPRFGLTARLFLQALAAVYFVAFISLLPQLPGLLGHQGLLPATDFLAALKSRMGLSALWYAPTLAWFGAQAGALQFMAIVGALASLLAIGGILTVPCFLVMWALHLSLTVVGQDFMSFQWDNLLLEAGFLAIFLTPFRWTTKYAARVPVSPLVVWLYNFLLFRLCFSSGLSKLVSGDLSWRHLTALQYHFETQPLPTQASWFAHHLPVWFLKVAALATFGFELLVPLLFLLPRRARALGAGLAALFQLMILATGNFAFFNWMTLALCILLLDDGMFERFFPKARKAIPHVKPYGRFRRWSLGLLAVLTITLGLAHLSALIMKVPRPLVLLSTAVSPLHIVNGYGLFAIMTTRRQEIVIEGSDDGSVWKEYAFRDKPGDVKRAPRIVAPFQPRLDWQMWFAALGDPDEDLWFSTLMLRLLQGSRPVLALFKDVPFPNAPPTYIRATIFTYRFTTLDEFKKDGAWWHRQMKTPLFPATDLRTFTGETR